MKSILKGLCLALALHVGALGVAVAEERGTADEAKAMVKKAQDHIKAVGPQKAFGDFSNKDDAKWHDKDLYVIAIDFKGDVVAHGTNKLMIGKNLMEMRDQNGVYLVRDMIEGAKAKGAGWQDYLFTHPATKKLEPKRSYYERIVNYDGIVFVGTYKK